MNKTLKGYLTLARPANLPTAVADILAGTAIAGLFTNLPLVSEHIIDLIFLALATIFLYAGGVVLNDVFDYKIDAVERPERPIPKGVVSKRKATIYGFILLALGAVLSFFVNQLCGQIAVFLALAILLYDSFSKRNGLLGPLNMGICRGLNLILGLAVLGNLDIWYFAIIPIIYISAITLISRGEVHGENKNHIIVAGLLYLIVIALVVVYKTTLGMNIMTTIPYLLLFAYLVYKPLIQAFRTNSPANIKKAVMAGVLSLVVLDASISVGFAPWWFGILILLLLPLSMYLSKRFAVT